MADPGLDALTASLRADWGLNRLFRSLALVEGFQFHILVCDNPRVAEAAFRLIEQEAGTAIQRLRPEPFYLKEPVPYEDLISAILEPLVWPKLEGEEAPGVTVIDASDAAKRDEASWRQLFRRMNERRNVIAERVPGTLILCVTPGLHLAFIQEAPDFWSIRGSEVTLEPLPAPVEPLGIRPEAEPARREERAPWIETEPERLRAAVEAVRQRVEERPDDASALRALMIQLDRLGRYEREWGDLEKAEAFLSEAVALARRLAKQRRDWRSDLAVALSNLGEVLVSRGSLDKAQEAYGESQDVMRLLLLEEPENLRLLRDLTVSLEQMGDVLVEQGFRERAEELYQESLTLRRRLLSREPEGPERLRDLAVSLNKLGDVLARRGSLERAQELYEESLMLRRRLYSRDPERAEWIRDLAVSLDRVGNVLIAQGALEKAQEAYEESLTLRRRLLGQDAERPAWLRSLSVSLNKVGNVLFARGSLDRAREAYEESLGVIRRLLLQNPERPEWLRDLAASASKVGTIHEAKGEPEQAASLYEQALQIVKDLQARFPDQPRFGEDVAWLEERLKAVRRDDQSPESST